MDVRTDNRYQKLSENRSPETPMSFEIIFLISAVLLPLVGNLKWRHPHALFLAASVPFLVFGIIQATETGIPLSQSPQIDRAYDDTYYVVAKGNYWRNLGFVMLALFAVTWLQGRFGAMRYPKLTVILFWMLHLGLLVIVGLPEIFHTFALMPRRYVDYPDVFRVLNFWSTLASVVAGVSLLALVSLLIFSCFETWKSRRAP